MNAFSAREERETYVARHKLTVDEFHRMGEAGVLPRDARVELFEGELIDMPPIGPAHASTVDHLVALLSPLAQAAVLRVQNPLGVGQRSELIPDLMLLRKRPGGNTASHPRPEDVLLLIEVSDTTLRYDRDDKMKLYAQQGVAESWLLDLGARSVEIYLLPGPEGYGQILRPVPKQVIVPSLVPGFSAAMRELFPSGG